MKHPAAPFSPGRLETAIALAAVAVGVILRFLHLETRPFGVDGDQALVMLFGLDAWAEGKFALFQSEMTRFETVASYFYLFFWKLFGSARALSALIALAEIALLYGLVRRESSPRVAAVAAAFLALSPWHWFYSRVTGPCVGPGLVLLAYWAWRDRPWRLLPLVFGWFYYGVLRFAWLWEAAKGGPRKWRVLGASAVLVVAVYSAFGVSLGEVARRGGYNWPRGAEAAATRISAWTSLWFAPPADSLKRARPEMVVDPVSEGFARLLGGNPALAWTGVAALLLMLVLVATNPRFRRDRKQMLLMTGIGAVALISSPTPSHGLALLPFVAWLAAEAVVAVSTRFQWFVVVFLAAFSLDGATASWRMLAKMEARGAVEDVFEDRWREIAETAARDYPTDRFAVFFVADQSFFSARWESLRRPETSALPALEPAELEPYLRRVGDGRREIVLIFDRWVPELGPHRVDEFRRGQQRLREMENFLRERRVILEQRAIERDGRELARLYRLPSS